MTHFFNHFCMALIGSVLSLGLFSCSAKHSGGASPTSSGFTPTDENGCISFSPFEYATWYKLDLEEEDLGSLRAISMRDSASMMLPDLTMLRDSILYCAFDTVCEPTQGARLLFEKAMQETGYPYAEATSAPAGADSVVAQGVVTVRGGVIALMPSYLSYIITNTSYVPPAAHGITGYWYVVAELPSGRVLKLTDIITQEGLKALPAIAKENARQENLEIDDLEKLPLPSGLSFYISSQGVLTLAYQVYEIACYAAGPINIPIYSWQISDYLTDTGRRILQP